MFNVNRACFPKEKHQNSHTQMGAKFMSSFRFGPFFGLVWVRKKGLSLENPEKNLKRGSRGLPAPGSKQRRKRVEKMTIFQLSFSALFGSFSTLLRAFSAPRPRGPGNPSSDFFGAF